MDLQSTVGCILATDEPVSFRIWHKTIGAHVEVRIFSSEFGSETAHGLNGTLRFRLTEWPAFKRVLEHQLICSIYPGATVSFTEDVELD